ncbi:S26 family signal peptidase [Natronomonas salina]|uniref:S26 family signal peptidase n=1 Tax=Natronomonas salina TaxID=1710540 RepID=UPI0015B51EC1|nr:S26 family signal peptidase [Natronomonas salina]QLD88815.1 S26 family signal peptidase [Natronomonas salina]
MAARSTLSGVLTVAVVLAVALLVIGQFLGQPLLFGYVTTGSMESALEPGDGFVAVPSVLAGSPEPGDVVVFEAETVQGGGLTTHRVVDVDDDGYVTKGDTNPFTDQDGGEPPVAEDTIVAHALQANGEVVAIPHLGTAATTVRDIAAAPFGALGEERAGTILVFLGMALFVLAGATGERGRRDTSRSRSRENVVAVWLIVLLAASIVAMGATAAMVVPAGTYDIEVLATEDPSDEPQVVAPGETATATYETHYTGVVPTLVVTDPLDDGVTVEPDRTVLGYSDSTKVTVQIEAPETAGTSTHRVRESRYLLILPQSVLLALHSVHPWLALLALNLVVAALVVTLAVAVFGTGYLRIRPGPDVPLKVRLERRFR